MDYIKTLIKLRLIMVLFKEIYIRFFSKQLNNY